MLAQSNPVGNRRRAVPLNLSHAPPITDTSSPLRIMGVCPQGDHDNEVTMTYNVLSDGRTPSVASSQSKKR
jgi:hypothetical protein